MLLLLIPMSIYSLYKMIMNIPSEMNFEKKVICYGLIFLGWLGCVGMVYTVISYYTGL